jgi:bla regulator protein BlaR1
VNLDLAVDLVVKSSVIFAACAVGLLALRRASASARHLFLVAGMAAMLALPILEIGLPRWEVPYFWVQLVSLEPTTSAGPASGDPASLPFWMVAWALGAGLVGLRLVAGLVAVSRARRRPLLPDGALRERLETFIGDRRARLLLGESGQSPMTWGWLRPALMMPPEAETWPTDRLQSVVRHEMAHVERFDWLTQTAARLVCALYWFHPGAWLMARWMERESERAADDLVISQGCSPETYAEHLVAVARAVRLGRSAMTVSMASRGPIRDRLTAVLAGDRNRRPLSRSSKGLLFGAVAALAAVVSAAGPRVVAQAPPSPPLVVAALPVQAKPAAAPGPDVAIRVHPEAVSPVVSPPPPSVEAARAPSQPARRATARKALAALSMVTQKVNAIKQRYFDGSNGVVEISDTEKVVPEVKVDIPAIHVDDSMVHMDIPAMHFRVPGIHIHIPKVHVEIPKVDVEG